jgi:hypothetical protein
MFQVLACEGLKGIHRALPLWGWWAGRDHAALTELACASCNFFFARPLGEGRVHVVDPARRGDVRSEAWLGGALLSIAQIR